MPRPPRYDDTVLLDAAVRIAAASGPAAVTMAAVAKESGAPNGSVYHRFPQRAVLLAELWLRSVGRFQGGYLAALDAHAADPPAAARAGARYVIAWSRANPAEAALLLHGPYAFGRAEWPAECVRRADEDNMRVFGAVAGLGVRLGAATPADHERVALALVELPLALVRRHTREGGGLPPYAEQLAEDAATDLIGALSRRS
ncbi:helix-turn-helix domain-containing protein [Kitasatospora sp. NPDC004240]